MFRPLIRAYLHFGRTPWWRILLGLIVVGLALVVFVTYPTHRPLLQATNKGDEREAALRVIRATAVVEARRIGVKAAGAVEDGPTSETPVPPSPPRPPGVPGPEQTSQTGKAHSKEPPRIVIAPGRVTITLGDDRSRGIATDLAEAEEQVRAALIEAGMDSKRAADEAKRMVGAARNPTTPEILPEAPKVSGKAAQTLEKDDSTEPSPDSDEDTRWHVRIWGIDFEGSGFANLPDEVAREPMLTVAQQAAIEQATRFDVRKALYGGVALAAYFLLALLLLITRAFAGRSVRQTQRVKVVEAAARVDSSARQIAEAQLKAMQAQVEPHFLFNTLAHVKALQEVDVQQAGNMLDHLITYLRTALPNLREGSSTLGKEFDLAQSYLNILKLRMGDRLHFSLDLPEALKSQSFPPALIINLVENAIKHGVERTRGGGSVRLNAQRVGHSIFVSVADTGKGLDPTAPSGTGVGLTSIRDRLQLLFGDEASLKLEPNSPSGVIATLTVPSVVPAVAPQHSSGMGSNPGIGLPNDASECKVHTSILLAAFGGFGGAHRWYLRRKKTALLQGILGLSTLIGLAHNDVAVPVAIIFFVWWITDIILIATKSMKDGSARNVVIDR
jgi:signal transduction histidine kinase